MFSSSGDCCAKNAGGIRVVFPLPGVADTMRLMRGLPKMRAIYGSMGSLGRSGILAGRFEFSFDFVELFCAFSELISSNSALFILRVFAFSFVERGVCFVVGFMDNRPGGDDFGSAQGRIFDADRAVMEHDDAFDNG